MRDHACRGNQFYLLIHTETHRNKFICKISTSRTSIGDSCMAKHGNQSFYSRKFEKIIYLLETFGTQEFVYFAGQNTSKFQSYGHWNCSNNRVTQCQGPINVLLRKSYLNLTSNRKTNFKNLIWFRHKVFLDQAGGILNCDTKNFLRMILIQK